MNNNNTEINNKVDKPKEWPFVARFIFKLIMMLVLGGIALIATESIEISVIEKIGAEFVCDNNEMYSLLIIIANLVVGKMLADILYGLIVNFANVKNVKMYLIARTIIVLVLMVVSVVLEIENVYVKKDNIVYTSIIKFESSTYEFDEIESVEAEIRDDGYFYYVLTLDERKIVLTNPYTITEGDGLYEGMERLEEFDSKLVDLGITKKIDDSNWDIIDEDEKMVEIIGSILD